MNIKKRIGQFFLVVVGLFLGLIAFAYLNPIAQDSIVCDIDGVPTISDINVDNIGSTEIYVNSSTLTEAENQLVIAGVGGAEHYFRVEVADTAEEMTKGLMYRYRMDENSGMLFVFPDMQQATFWMKNTYIPLDILFIDDKGVVVDMHLNAKPSSTDYIYSSVPVKAALEVNAGVAGKLGIGVNTKIYHPIF